MKWKVSFWSPQFYPSEVITNLLSVVSVTLTYTGVYSLFFYITRFEHQYFVLEFSIYLYNLKTYFQSLKIRTYKHVILKNISFE